MSSQPPEGATPPRSEGSSEGPDPRRADADSQAHGRPRAGRAAKGSDGAGTASSPMRLAPRGDEPPPLVFHRGTRAPYATRWFGVTSLAGHARNFVASAIAAESIDSRDWMHASTPEVLLSQVARVLGGDASKETLVDAMGRPVWVDFIADTGDDRDVSHAVARMLFATYAIDDDGTRRVLPRGDLLVFGGDTAYPVATGEEIARRVIAPYNEALRERHDGDDLRRRAVLGIPGNHDWYDGLDGFARLFRRKAHPSSGPDGASAGGGDDGSAPVSTPSHRRRRRRQAGAVARQLHLDEVGGFVHLVTDVWASIRALWAGTKVGRPRRLTIAGYEAVQDASYWALPLAPGLEAWGVDRQLGRLDYRQRLFFAERRKSAPHARLLFVAPEPAIAFGERHEPGARMLSACRLSLERDRIFYLTGDLHHYERRSPGPGSLHVIAGGGGAFLHGTRISPSPSGPPDCTWPSPSASRRLLAQVPLKLMVGSAGFMLHIALALVAAFVLAASARGTAAVVAASALAGVVISAALYANVGRKRAHRRLAAALSVPFGAALGFLPMGLRLALVDVVPVLESDAAAMLVAAFVGSLGIGIFFAAAALLGLEREQAFSVLGHPGFKEFVRMCVHPSGRIEAWIIGKDDPLGPGEAELVDRFDWTC